MKLALLVLAIETCLARIFVNSWAQAMLIVVLYCVAVYIWRTFKNRKRRKSTAPHQVNMIQHCIDNRNRRSQSSDIYQPVALGQNN